MIAVDRYLAKRIAPAFNLTEGVDLFYGHHPEERNKLHGGTGAPPLVVSVVASGTEGAPQHHIGGESVDATRNVQVFISGNRGRFEQTRMLAQRIQNFILDDAMVDEFAFQPISSLIPLGFMQSGSYLFSMNFSLNVQMKKSFIVIGKNANTTIDSTVADAGDKGALTYSFSRSHAMTCANEHVYAMVNKYAHIGHDLSLFVNGTKLVSPISINLVYSGTTYTVLCSAAPFTGSVTVLVE